MFGYAYRFNKVLSKWTLNNSVIVTDMFQVSPMTYHNSPTPTISNNKLVFKPTTKTLLQTAVDEWIGGDTTTYGDINTWDVSEITDMSELFKNGRLKQGQSLGGQTIDTTSFNSNISGWTVSAVTDMSSMFQGATLFNQDISAWKTNGTGMLEGITLTNMFDGANAMLENTGVVVPTYANWEMQSICFRGDTQIKTSDGYKNIENLKRGIWL